MSRDAVNDLALHYLAKMKVLVVREIEREDIEFIAQVSKATFYCYFLLLLFSLLFLFFPCRHLAVVQLLVLTTSCLSTWDQLNLWRKCQLELVK